MLIADTCIPSTRTKWKFITNALTGQVLKSAQCAKVVRRIRIADIVILPSLSAENEGNLKRNFTTIKLQVTFAETSRARIANVTFFAIPHILIFHHILIFNNVIYVRASYLQRR